MGYLSPPHSGANMVFPSLCWCKLAVCKPNFSIVIQNEILGRVRISSGQLLKTPNELINLFCLSVKISNFISVFSIMKIVPKWFYHHKKQTTKASVNQEIE